MTIRQLAETAGCGINTVSRLGKIMFPEVRSKSRGIAKDYSKEQSIAIMEKLPKKKYIADPSEVHNDIQMDINDSNKVMMQFMAQMQKQQQDFFEKVLTRISAPQENKPLQIASTKTTRSLLNQNVYNYAKDKLDGDIREAWNNVYEELYFIAHVKIRVRSKNSGKSKLDCIEEAGLLECANKITLELIGE